MNRHEARGNPEQTGRRRPDGRPKRWRWAFAVAGMLVLVPVIAVLLFDWNWLREPARQAIETATGRETRIHGRLAGEWSLRPRFIVEDFHLANADWARDEEMISLERAEIVIDLPELLRGRMVLPEIRLVKPVVSLERRADGEASWNFAVKEAADAVAPEDRTEMPLIGRLLIEDGRLAFRDAPAGLDIDARMSSVTGSGGEGEETVRLEGQGSLRGERFRVAAQGGSLLALRENEAPYPLTLDMTVGETRGRLTGSLDDPITFEGLDLEIALAGPDLAKLTKITGVPLPMTPPYDLSGHLRRDGPVLRIEGMAGRVGNSDLGGDLRIDTGRERLYVEADLRSRALDYRDVGPLVGLRPEPQRTPVRPAEAEETGKGETAADPPAAVPRRVLPDAPLAIEQIRAVDAKVRFRGDKVEAPNAPLSGVDLELVLENSQLHIRPLRLGVAGGAVRAEIRIDARTDAVLTEYNIRLNRFRLEDFLSSAGLKDAGSGRIDGRIRLVGYGDTVQKSLGSANGEVKLTIDKGTLSDLAASGVGLDVARVLGIVIGGDKPVPLNCFVADFGVERGIMTPRVFVLDTQRSTVTADGNISLRDEQLGLSMLAYPKEPTLLSARTPITINGPLSQPEIGIAPVPVAARAAGAVALGVLLTPLASILAFIEPGLEQDSDCVALLEQAGRRR